MINMLDKYYGCLLGLAIGDALGAPIEFSTPGTFTSITDYIDGGYYGLKKGQWTDDTSVALCLGESLIKCQGFNAKDQMDTYCLWYTQGHLSSTGTCFDIGNTMRKALCDYQQNKNPFAGSTNAFTAGNGSLMRIAPVPMFFKEPTTIVHMAALSSKTTHAASEAVDACRYYAYLIKLALDGATKDQILAPLSSLPDREPITSKIIKIAAGAYKTKMPPDIQGTGYVIQSLEAALWSFYRTTSFKEAVLTAVNLGDDADTTGAICGQLAGAYYGYAAIPEHWIKDLCKNSFIKTIAKRLYQSKNTREVES